MYKRLLRYSLAFRRLTFIRIVRRTLVALFPIALIGAVSRFIQLDVFNENGFIYNILFAYNWLPDNVLNAGRTIFTGLTNVSLGMTGLYAAMIAAKYTARFHHRDDQMAGITGIAAMLMLAFRYPSGGNEMSFEWRLFNGRMVFVGMLIGYLVGLVFKYFGQPVKLSGHEHVITIQRRMFKALKLMLAVIGVALVINTLINLLVNFNVIAVAYGNLQDFSNGDQPAWIKAGLSFLTTFLEWLGMSGPYNVMNATSSSAINANLAYALANHGGHVPYPYLGTTIYNSFGTFGGAGLCMAMLIAIAVEAQSVEDHQLIRWNMLPVLFNVNYGVLFGVPVILNLFYFIPFFILPVVNMMLAVGAIALHIIPTPVYSVPSGTPGPLVAFLGTNGDWIALIFSLLLLVVDVICYRPFVRLAMQVEHEAQRVDREADANA